MEISTTARCRRHTIIFPLATNVTNDEQFESRDPRVADRHLDCRRDHRREAHRAGHRVARGAAFGACGGTGDGARPPRNDIRRVAALDRARPRRIRAPCGLVLDPSSLSFRRRPTAVRLTFRNATDRLLHLLTNPLYG